MAIAWRTTTVVASRSRRARLDRVPDAGPVPPSRAYSEAEDLDFLVCGVRVALEVFRVRFDFVSAFILAERNSSLRARVIQPGGLTITPKGALPLSCSNEVNVLRDIGVVCSVLKLKAGEVFNVRRE